MNRFKPIYEDDHLLAISKPRGILTVGNKPRQKNLLDEVKKEYIKRSIRLRPLNRLDRDTSGIVLFAKTKECYEEAVEKKKFSGTTKTYIAIIKGIPQRKFGAITFPLPSRQDKRKMLPSETKYKVIESYSFRSGAASVVEVTISSGRFHQIRRHFSMIHHPLHGSRIHGQKRLQVLRQNPPFLALFPPRGEDTVKPLCDWSAAHNHLANDKGIQKGNRRICLTKTSSSFQIRPMSIDF